MAAKSPTALKLKEAPAKKNRGTKVVPPADAAKKPRSAGGIPAVVPGAEMRKPGRAAAEAMEAKTAASTRVAKVDAKAEKPRKTKLVRDSFTIPKSEYAALDTLKQRAAKLGSPARKSEVLRGGILALAEMSDEAFSRVMASVPTLKTGRPSKT